MALEAKNKSYIKWVAVALVLASLSLYMSNHEMRFLALIYATQGAIVIFAGGIAYLLAKWRGVITASLTGLIISICLFAVYKFTVSKTNYEVEYEAVVPFLVMVVSGWIVFGYWLAILLVYYRKFQRG